MAQSFAEKVINTNELYHVAQKPLILDNFNDNIIEEGDYGYGIYLYPNKEDAIRAAAFLSLKLQQQRNDAEINLYKYTFNPIGIDYNQLQDSSWMFKWRYNENNPYTISFDKANWNCYAFLWRQYIIAHQNDNPKPYGFDCSLVCGPIVDLNLIMWLWGDDLQFAEPHYQNLVNLDPKTPIEFCFKSKFSLAKLCLSSVEEQYDNWIRLNLRINELNQQ